MSYLKLLVIFLVVTLIFDISAVGSTDMEVDELAFKQFQLDYQKTYSTKERHLHAFDCFKENLKISAKLNKEDPHAEYGITQFSDLCTEEFKRMYLSAIKVDKPYKNLKPLNNTVPEMTMEAAKKIIEENAAVDWSTTDAVGPVQDQ